MVSTLAPLPGTILLAGGGVAALFLTLPLLAILPLLARLVARLLAILPRLLSGLIARLLTILTLLAGLGTGVLPGLALRLVLARRGGSAPLQ